MSQISGVKRRGLTPEFYRQRLIRQLEEQGITDLRVLEAMGRVPRHAFVDPAWDPQKAYENTALPIGRAQTISQPFVVALMSQALLAAGPLRHVLEVGTGCGYQTAILAELVDRVYSVERIKSLYASAGQRLRALNYLRVYLKHGDGANGWSQQAPLDGIIVTAAGEQVPPALLEQLSPGGRLDRPLGPAGAQNLVRLTRQPNGQLLQETLAQVSFVPLLPETQA